MIYLLMQICLRASNPNKWYIDSGCSRHMTGDQSKFASIKHKDGGKVTFGGNESEEFFGIGKIGNSNGPQIKDVYLVDGLCHNLLSVSQSTDKGNLVIFDSEECLIVSIRTIMVENLRTMPLENAVIVWESIITSRLQEPHKENGVVERKNRVLTEMARSMLNENQTSQVFWVDAMSTLLVIYQTGHISRKKLEKTPYELYKGRKPNLAHLQIFGCKCFIHNNGKDAAWEI
ncbi:hypothetical protein K1719_018633 [Acacia pycnantha]|nr:hypothetical protein K1719_018633 [Acacia pycnantha]